MAAYTTTYSSVEVFTTTINVLTIKNKQLLLNSETECTSISSAKMRRCMFGNARLTIHKLLFRLLCVIHQTWLNPYRGFYLAMDYETVDCNVPKNLLLLPDTLGTFYAIFYIVRYMIDAPGCGFPCLLRMSVDYAQPSYVAAIYGATFPILTSYLFKKWYPSTYFNEHPRIRLRFSHTSFKSHEEKEWNCLLFR